MAFSCAILILGCGKAEKRANVIVNEVSGEFDSNEDHGTSKIYNQENLARAQFYRLLSSIETNGYNDDNKVVNAVFVNTLSKVFINSNSYVENLLLSEQFSRLMDGQLIVQELEIQNVSESLLTIVALVKNNSRNETNSETFQPIRIKADLVCSLGELPLFANFDINEISSAAMTAEKISESQNQNRALSTIYYWLGLLEQLEGEVNPFQEILGPEFQMKFSTGTQISSNTKMESWLNTRAKLLTDSQHEIYQVESILNDQNQMVVTMLVDWNGLTRDDNVMNAKTNQTWILNINDGMSFPQIINIEIEQIAPFTIVNS